MEHYTDLENKIALVTGASAGMGKSITTKFLQAGMIVIGTGRRKEKLEKLVENLSKEERKHFIPFCGDVGNTEDNLALIDFVKTKFERLDVLVNNAGIMDGMTPIGDVSDQLWYDVMNVNINGPFELCRAAVHIMLAQGKGNIINIASGGGIGGGRAGAAYVASKFALVGLSKNIAYMYALEGIRCNCICPGGVATEIGGSIEDYHPLGLERVMQAGTKSIRIGEPDEIGEVALFLASDRSSLLNGVALPADAGRSAW